MKNILKSRKITNIFRKIFDEYFPRFIRDSRILNIIIAKVYCGKAYTAFDLDFKIKAPFMSEDEFNKAYEKLCDNKNIKIRPSDMSDKEKEFLIKNIVGDSILEVGSGDGNFAYCLAKTGKKVMATEIIKKSLTALQKKAEKEKIKLITKYANLENLPFTDKYFDTTVCAHTLEHIRNIDMAIKELKRVTRKRILIIVPETTIL